MTLESGIAFFIAILIFAVTPGPGVFALLAKGLSRGTRECWPLAIGMSISDVLYLVAAAYGLAALAQNWAELFTLIRILGALYLFYLAYKMWTAPLDLTEIETTGGKRDAKGWLLNFTQGFLISASNPKVILFYIAFLPTFMDITALGPVDLAIASLTAFVALMIGLMAISIFASKARSWFKSEAAVKRLNRSAGSLMAAAATYLLAKQ